MRRSFAKVAILHLFNAELTALSGIDGSGEGPRLLRGHATLPALHLPPFGPQIGVAEVSPVSRLVHSGVSGATGGEWLYRPAPRRSPSIRLFCFPYAGVGASVFRQWPAGLPVEFDVCAVQLPGRTVRLSEPPVASIPELVDGIVAAVTPYLDIPFVFFGHSMGAILAAEVTRELAAKRGPAAALSDCVCSAAAAHG